MMEGEVAAGVEEVLITVVIAATEEAPNSKKPVARKSPKRIIFNLKFKIFTEFSKH